MISINKYDPVNGGAVELYGLSTDTKPTTQYSGIEIKNGSTYLEMNTGKVYIFNEEGSVWLEV